MTYTKLMNPKGGVMRVLLMVVCVAMLAGCGGGGGGSGSDSVQKFTVADISGKTLYLVEDVTTQPAEFRTNGAMVAALEWDARIQTYTPRSEGTGKWSVVDGVLVLTSIPDTGTYVTYTLLNNDTTNRYYMVQKKDKTGATGTVGFFYDQSTGSTQAHDYVVARYKP